MPGDDDGKPMGMVSLIAHTLAAIGRHRSDDQQPAYRATSARTCHCSRTCCANDNRYSSKPPARALLSRR